MTTTPDADQAVVIEKFATYGGDQSIHFEENPDLAVQTKRGGVPFTAAGCAVLVLLNEDDNDQHVVMVDPQPNGSVKAVEETIKVLQGMQVQLLRHTGEHNPLLIGQDAAREGLTIR